MILRPRLHLYDQAWRSGLNEYGALGGLKWHRTVRVTHNVQYSIAGNAGTGGRQGRATRYTCSGWPATARLFQGGLLRLDCFTNDVHQELAFEANGNGSDSMHDLRRWTFDR